MEMPPPDPQVSARFHELVARHPEVSDRKMFGQPAAFVNGNLCFGVFGGDLFVRLADKSREALGSPASVRTFEPMAGRPMRGYLVIPERIRSDPRELDRWVESAIRYVESLPAKAPRRAQPARPVAAAKRGVRRLSSR